MIADGRPSLNGDEPLSLEGEDEDELAAVLDAYLAEVEAGRPVDPEDWVRRHPAIAGRLRACLRSLHLVEAAAEALDITPGPEGAAPAATGAGPDPSRRARTRTPSSNPTPTPPGSATSASSARSAAAAWAWFMRPWRVRWAAGWR